jgi:hypothetical protein
MSSLSLRPARPLIAKRDRVVTRDEILKPSGGAHRSEATLRPHQRRPPQSATAAGHRPDRTVACRGFRFVGEVRAQRRRRKLADARQPSPALTDAGADRRSRLHDRDRVASPSGRRKGRGPRKDGELVNHIEYDGAARSGLQRSADWPPGTGWYGTTRGDRLSDWDARTSPSRRSSGPETVVVRWASGSRYLNFARRLGRHRICGPPSGTRL